MQYLDVNFGISRALAIFCKIISQFLCYNMDLRSSNQTISIAQSVHNSRKTDRSIPVATLASKSQNAEAQSDHVIYEYLAAYFWLWRLIASNQSAGNARTVLVHVLGIKKIEDV